MMRGGKNEVVRWCIVDQGGEAMTASTSILLLAATCSA